jgi:hypothetical protein
VINTKFEELEQKCTPIKGKTIEVSKDFVNTYRCNSLFCPRKCYWIIANYGEAIHEADFERCPMIGKAKWEEILLKVSE